MRRREFVLSALSTATVTIAGCLDGDNGEPDVDSRFAGEDCPTLDTPGRDADEVRCYHVVGTQPDIHLVPESEVGNPLTEPLELTLHNGSGAEVEAGLSNWRLYKTVDGSWRSVTPFREGLETETLGSEDSHAWSLEMSRGYVDQRARVNPGESDMAYTGSGTYVFRTTVTDGDGDRIALLALFEIDGEPLELEPVGVDGYEVEADTAHVEREGAGDDDVNIVVSTRKVDDDLDTVPLLAEVAAQLHPVNNALAFFEDYGVGEVRSEGGGSLALEMELLHRSADMYANLHGEAVFETAEDGPADDFPYRFGFRHDGQAYELTVEELVSGM